MLRKTITIALLLILALSNVSYGIKLFGQADTRLGAYTGPVGGTEQDDTVKAAMDLAHTCLLYTSPSPRDRTRSRMPSSA